MLASRFVSAPPIGASLLSASLHVWLRVYPSLTVAYLFVFAEPPLPIAAVPLPPACQGVMSKVPPGQAAAASSCGPPAAAAFSSGSVRAPGNLNRRAGLPVPHTTVDPATIAQRLVDEESRLLAQEHNRAADESNMSPGVQTCHCGFSSLCSVCAPTGQTQESNPMGFHATTQAAALPNASGSSVPTVVLHVVDLREINGVFELSSEKDFLVTLSLPLATTIGHCRERIASQIASSPKAVQTDTGVYRVWILQPVVVKQQEHDIMVCVQADNDSRSLESYDVTDHSFLLLAHPSCTPSPDSLLPSSGAAPALAAAASSSVSSVHEAGLPSWVPSAYRDHLVTNMELQPLHRQFLAWQDQADAAGKADSRHPPFVIPPTVLPCLDNQHRSKLLAFLRTPPYADLLFGWRSSSSDPPVDVARIHEPAVELLEGVVCALGSVCSIRMAKTAATGFRFREHLYAIMTNSHCVEDEAALMSAEFWFHYTDGREPLVLRACPADGSRDRRCWRVKLPDPELVLHGVAGLARPDLAMVIFEPDSVNGKLLKALNDEPDRLFPSVVGHYPDETQLPLSQCHSGPERRQALEQVAAKFFMPHIGQPLAMLHAAGDGSDAAPVVLASLFGHVTEAAANPATMDKERFLILQHNLYCIGGCCGSPIFGPDGELVAVHFTGWDPEPENCGGGAVALTEAIRATLAVTLLNIPHTSERCITSLNRLLNTVLKDVEPFPVEEV